MHTSCATRCGELVRVAERVGSTLRESVGVPVRLALMQPRQEAVAVALSLRVKLGEPVPVRVRIGDAVWLPVGREEGEAEEGTQARITRSFSGAPSPLHAPGSPKNSRVTGTLQVGSSGWPCRGRQAPASMSAVAEELQEPLAR